jgi:hypothetical protein
MCGGEVFVNCCTTKRRPVMFFTGRLFQSLDPGSPQRLTHDALLISHTPCAVSGDFRATSGSRLASIARRTVTGCFRQFYL